MIGLLTDGTMDQTIITSNSVYRQRFNNNKDMAMAQGRLGNLRK